MYTAVWIDGRFPYGNKLIGSEISDVEGGKEEIKKHMAEYASKKVDRI